MSIFISPREHIIAANDTNARKFVKDDIVTLHTHDGASISGFINWIGPSEIHIDQSFSNDACIKTISKRDIKHICEYRKGEKYEIVQYQRYLHCSNGSARFILNKNEKVKLSTRDKWQYTGYIRLITSDEIVLCEHIPSYSTGKLERIKLDRIHDIWSVNPVEI